MNSPLSKLLQPQIASLRVLVVDDDDDTRKIIGIMLTAIGVKSVIGAPDGATGLAAVRKNNPDLVIVDWEMPHVDGAEFVRMVRSAGTFPMPDVPIIMLSGHAERWRVLEAARIGAHEYVLKPVSIQALHDRIVAIIGQPRPVAQSDGHYGSLTRPVVVLDDVVSDDAVAVN